MKQKSSPSLQDKKMLFSKKKKKKIDSNLRDVRKNKSKPFLKYNTTLINPMTMTTYMKNLFISIYKWHVYFSKKKFQYLYINKIFYTLLSLQPLWGQNNIHTFRCLGHLVTIVVVSAKEELYPSFISLIVIVYAKPITMLFLYMQPQT